MPLIPPEDQKQVHAARRVCELFRGRFSEEIALNLIKDFGGELQAVDFVLNERGSVVSEYLKKHQAYVEDLRSDSKKIASLLEKGIEYELRQFACGDCERAWWKKVPFRKQVSKCKKCHIKYDPVPQNKEWGWAKFVCPCSHIFHAYGEMGVTKSDCYKCGAPVSVTAVLPPRKRIGSARRSNNPHSCNGINCFSHDDDFVNGMNGLKMVSYKSTHASHHNNITYNVNAGSSGTSGKKGATGNTNSAAAAGDYASNSACNDTTPVCVHPKSSKPGRRIRTPSKKHVSTGSTVNTFLSQGSLDTATVSVAYTLDRIDEL